jgi:sigma-B regulation protein RsbU (phosphoserine phosphatase)
MSAQRNQSGFDVNNLVDEIKNLQFKKDIKREYHDLKDFYLDDEKKDKLKEMDKLKRFLYQTGYLFSSIFQKLTPLRKLLVFVGLIFLFLGRSIHVNNQSYTNDSAFWGGLLIFFVLVLELKDKLLAVEELIAGKKIQKALMPEETPSINGWDVFLFTTSANEVSGDLVDYLKINDEKINVTIADVAGKGLSAALVTAKLQATVRAYADISSSPAELTNKTNKIFNRDSLPNIFASMIYLEMFTTSGKLKFANAGHLPPIVLRNEGLTELEKGDAALGILTNGAYRDFELQLNENEIFIGYSDGITEAINEVGEFFGKEKLFSAIRGSNNLNAIQLGHKIIHSVEQFRGQAKISDDISLVILKRNYSTSS